MDEIVGSCMVCGQQRKFVIWHESGIAGVCAPCRRKAGGEECGYVLFKPPYALGQSVVPAAIHGGRVYHSIASAQKALEGIVWHNRDGWQIRPVSAFIHDKGDTIIQQRPSSEEAR